MEIPGWVIEQMWKVVDDHPALTWVAVFSDTLGGWNMTYVATKARAEELTAGQKNTEVVHMSDEAELCQSQGTALVVSRKTS